MSKKPSVLVGVPLDEAAGELLRKHADITVHEFIDHGALVKNIKDYDALISGGAKCDEEVFSAATNLRIVASHGMGYDTIDVKAATRHGVMVTNSPGVMAESVAEHALALMLSAARRIPQADRDVKDGKASWAKYRGIELWGKTLGQIGIGRIGWLIAKKARDAFNMNVLAYDPYVEPERFLIAGATPVPFDKLLMESDIISISVPLNEETRGMIGQKEFDLMKKGSIILNTARAGVINEEALLIAIRDERVGQAALDVFEEEPGKKSPLLAEERVILTPHQGANTISGFAAIARATVENVLMALEGKCPKNILNPSVWQEPNA